VQNADPEDSVEEESDGVSYNIESQKSFPIWFMIFGGISSKIIIISNVVITEVITVYIKYICKVQ
jgi:hypothetical protein